MILSPEEKNIHVAERNRPQNPSRCAETGKMQQLRQLPLDASWAAKQWHPADMFKTWPSWDLNHFSACYSIPR